MERQKADALFAIEQDRELLWDLSDQIWEHPEVGGHPHRFFRQLRRGGAGDRLPGRV